MKALILIILLFFQGFFQNEKPNRITIFMVGDSTMADKPLEDNPERGWGMMLQQFFDSSVVVENNAMNGRSTRTFISENRWQAVVDRLKAGDYVIIQFGHNDGSPEKKDRYTTPSDYCKNLVKFVNETRAKNAIPILCTPIMRRRFDNNGIFYDTHGVYPDIVRKIADSLQVPLVDMHKKSEELIVDYGAEESKKIFLFIDSVSYKSIPHGKQDNTHFSKYGAMKMAELFIEGIKELDCELKSRFNPASVQNPGRVPGRLCENPIIHADYSDPDVINVNDTFYMVSSSFNCVPGLPILKSVDLVNWKILTYAVKRLEPEEVYSKPMHGCGIWAPAIRFHNSKFYIYYSDPDYGIFVTTAKNIAGPWSKPVCVKSAKGWIDPCPFWDNDGTAYLVHAYAGSRAGIKSILVINQMNIEGTEIVDEGTLVFDGHVTDPTVEGPKMYKRNGYYYIFAPAGGVKTGWQLVLRSKKIYGPYEKKIVLNQGNTLINGPHQGAWVEDKNGKSWFIHFQDKEAYGRVVHLQPLNWIGEWPVIGSDKDNDGTGEPVHIFYKPFDESVNNFQLQTSDEFDSTEIGLQWQWHANPQPNWAYITNTGSLRLYSVLSKSNLWDTPNLLLQKFPGEEFSAVTKISISNFSAEEKFGLVIMGMDYSYLGVNQKDSLLMIYQSFCKDAYKGGTEIKIDSAVIKTGIIYLNVTVKKESICTFSFSTDGNKFLELGKQFQAKPGKWIGAKIGIFCTRNQNTNDSGYADIDYFRFDKIKK